MADFPEEIRTRIEELAGQISLSRLKEIANAISERYRDEENKQGKVLVSRDEEALAYAVVRMPATFGAVSDALAYGCECADLSEVKTMLDVGAGCGAASFAAAGQLKLTEVTCLEREPAMQRLGKELMTGKEVLRDAKWISGNLVTQELSCKADLVLSSYVLNELKDEEQILAVQKLWQSAQQALLILEPGTRAGFQVINRIREYVLEQGGHIAAPCPHEGVCRLSKEDWCHNAVRIQRSRVHRLIKGEVPYEDEKYSYLLAVKNEPSRAENRVLRHPYIEKGFVRVNLCTKEENREVTIRKKDGDLYKKARKAKQGDALC